MFSLLTPLVQFWKRKDISIYDNVFNLHSKVTVCILFTFTIFLSANQYFGIPIDCFLSDKDMKSSMNNYCWITGTYTSKSSYFRGEIGRDIVSYGISALRPVPFEDRNYQKYYQWVATILCLQAISFYLPAYCWKVWENRTLSRLVGEIHNHLLGESCSSGQLSSVAKYILLRDYAMTHNIYAIRYLIAECMNYVILILNMVCVNYFLESFWWDFKPAINILFAFEYETWSWQTARYFPKLSKCEFFSVGPSGTIQRFDALCLLPLNVLNEKMYAFLYIWFLALFFISTINLLYKIALLVCSPLRMAIIKLKFRDIDNIKWYDVLNGGQYGQWFLFIRLGQNLSTNVMRMLVDKVYSIERQDYFIE